MAWVRFGTGARDFSHLHRVQTDSGANLASYLMCVGGAQCESDHSPPCNAEVKICIHSPIFLHDLVLN